MSVFFIFYFDLSASKKDLMYLYLLFISGDFLATPGSVLYPAVRVQSQSIKAKLIVSIVATFGHA